MTIEAIKNLIAQLIGNHQLAIKMQIFFAIFLILTGIGLIVLGFFVFNDRFSEGYTTVVNVGGGLIASISAFPLKDVFQRKDKIAVFRSVKLQLDETIDELEMDKIEELLWKLIEKTAVG